MEVLMNKWKNNMPMDLYMLV